MSTASSRRHDIFIRIVASQRQIQQLADSNLSTAVQIIRTSVTDSRYTHLPCHYRISQPRNLLTFFSKSPCSSSTATDRCKEQSNGAVIDIINSRSFLEHDEDFLMTANNIAFVNCSFFVRRRDVKVMDMTSYVLKTAR